MTYNHLRKEALESVEEYTLFNTPEVTREERRGEQGEEFNLVWNYIKYEIQTYQGHLRYYI